MHANRLLVPGIALFGASAAAQADFSYTFDTDAEGWSSINDTSALVWDGSIGTPAGALRGVDQVSGDIWFFSAPSDALGDLSGFYGGAISYDILGIVGSQTSISPRADIMLVGAGTQIGIDLSVQPQTDAWTSWSTTVDAASAWKLVGSTLGGSLTSTDASEAQIRAVLGDLDGFYIRGEYTNGSDSAAIDNVSFVPAPAGMLAMLGLGCVAGRRRR